MDPVHGAFAEFSHTYSALPEHFYARVPPTPVAAPALIAFNDDLASELGIERNRWSDNELAAICAGNRVPAGALPLAMAYAGHQFGSFVQRHFPHQKRAEWNRPKLRT
jgi:serine/tyrosine/threonine adenylyltransferase